MNAFRIAAAQTPDFRSDTSTAMAHLAEVVELAAKEGAKLVCFPECFLQGYFTDEASARRLALDLSSHDFAVLLQEFPDGGPTIVLGMIESQGARLFNTAIVVRNRAVMGRYRKAHLLDGERCFTPGVDAPIFDVDGLRFGINICYDTNFSQAAQRIANQGASLIVCPTNNMMPRHRAAEFKDMHNAIRAKRCQETSLWLVSADVTGERDGRVAWGPTAVLNPRGEVAAQLPLGKPAVLIFDLPLGLD